jgi:hypothetical protein
MDFKIRDLLLEDLLGSNELKMKSLAIDIYEYSLISKKELKWEYIKNKFKINIFNEKYKTIIAIDNNNNYLGIANFFIIDYWLDDNLKIIHENIFHAKSSLSKKEKLIILNKFYDEITNWGINNNIDIISIGAPIFNNFNKFLEKKGFSKCENIYRKELKK